jgi:dTDP-4-amino-4,6-dideoxygalactose transaminase
MIPLIDLKKQYKSIHKEIDEAIMDVIHNCEFVQGKRVEQFEKDFAKINKAKHCVACGSGTEALHLALLSLSIGFSDKVIVPTNTFIATAEAVIQTDATPVFVDIDEFYNLNPEGLENIIETETPSAIIVVHLYGQPAQIDKIQKICKKYNLLLIEDCAQAHLSEFNEQKVGTFGDVGCFSFYPGKNLGAYGEAGALITDNVDIANKARFLRNHGSMKRYKHEISGFNYRMDEIQAAVLNVKLKYLDEWNNKRIQVAKWYNEELKDLQEIELPKVQDNVKHTYHLYVIKASDKKVRNELAEFLNNKGISTAIHYPIPLHLSHAYRELDFVGTEDLSKSENACNRILSLPMYPELEKEEVKFVCDKIKEYYNR